MKDLMWALLCVALFSCLAAPFYRWEVKRNTGKDVTWKTSLFWCFCMGSLVVIAYLCVFGLIMGGLF